MAAALRTWNTDEYDILSKFWGIYSFDSPCQRELMIPYFKVDSIKVKYFILSFKCEMKQNQTLRYLCEIVYRL